MSAYCTPGTGPDQRLATYGHGPHPACCLLLSTKFYWETHTHLYVYVLPMAAFMLQWQELNSCNKLHKNIYYPALYRNSLLTFHLDTRGIKKIPTLTYPIVSQGR